MSLVLVSDEGRVRILRLNRPDARNALSADLRTELIQCLHEAANNGSIGAIVIAAEGKTFAAGADLKELIARSPEEQRHFLNPPHIYSIIENLAKPVIAAIHGHALGAGLELATACDVRVCAAEAKLGQPEITLGLIPGGGGTQRVARLVGQGAAARLILTGEAILASEALSLGLVDVVVPSTDVVKEALRIATLMASQDGAALAAAKRSLQAAREKPYSEGLAKEIDEFVSLHGRSDTRERIQAFLDRPKP